MFPQHLASCMHVYAFNCMDGQVLRLLDVDVLLDLGHLHLGLADIRSWIMRVVQVSLDGRKP